MNFLFRPFVYLSRGISKTFAFLMIVFVLGCVVACAISVQRAIQNTNANLRIAMPAVASIQVDEIAITEYHGLTGDRVNLEPLTMDMLTEIGTLSYVRDYDISTAASLAGYRLERVIAGEDTRLDVDVDVMWELVDLKGISNPDLLDAQEGVIEIISGRTFTESEARSLSYTVLISENFAHLNGLGVGSTLTLDNVVWAEESILTYRSYDFEVIGIFTPVVEINTGDAWMDNHFMEEIENRIYTSNDVVFAVTQFQIDHAVEMFLDEGQDIKRAEDVLFLESIYSLYDVGYLEDFRIAAQKIIPEFWLVEGADSSFDDITSSMETLNNLAFAVIWVTVGAGILMMSLLIVLFLRDRRYEIGIYLALGEKKSRIIAQMMIEVLTVALVAVTLSLFAGNVLASSMSESMLRNDMIAGRAYAEMSTFGVLDTMGVITDMSADEMLARYDVSLDFVTIVSFFTVSITTVVASTMMPMFYIVRLNPKRIML